MLNRKPPVHNFGFFIMCANQPLLHCNVTYLNLRQ